MIAGSRLLFLKLKYVVFVSIAPHYYDSDVKMTSDTKIQTFSNHGHVLVTLHVQFLCSDWLKFDRWVHT